MRNLLESDCTDVLMKRLAKLCLSNEAISESKIQDFLSAGITEVETLYIDMINFGDQIRNTLLLDKTDHLKMHSLKSLRD